MTIYNQVRMVVPGHVYMYITYTDHIDRGNFQENHCKIALGRCFREIVINYLI